MNRRSFVHHGAALAGAVALAQPLIAQDAAVRPGSNRGTVYKSVKTNGNVSRKKLIQLKDLGFDGIESSSPGVPDIPALVRECKDIGLAIHGVVDMVHWKQRLSSPDAAVREIGRKALEQALRDSHAMGGSSVLLVPGAVNKDNESHDDVWNRSIEEIQKVLPTASWYGQRILIETVWNGFCYKPEQFRDYIDACNSIWVGAYYDIGNMQKMAPSHEWIRTLGKRCVKFDVKDWGVKAGFCKLGDGDVDWPEVRKAMDEIGFTGWVTREGSDGGVEHTAALMDELLDL